MKGAKAPFVFYFILFYFIGALSISYPYIL